MAQDQAVIDTVARKFQEFASGLPEQEQEALATWMTQRGGDEMQGYSAYWWREDGAYESYWRESANW